ncbi:hypothetical protein Vau01_062910 [Virgisporangium aurantiacum]|uniref:Uncharacterized protein n=1 Tax=Virgisporangium aurantiacum TaxID=175570 RepID=A0A8J3ZBR6_9ACTN|nr:hypothetical protein Vau01_062910 [Virgisporangium aurantiacum]
MLLGLADAVDGVVGVQFGRGLRPVRLIRWFGLSSSAHWYTLRPFCVVTCVPLFLLALLLGEAVLPWVAPPVLVGGHADCGGLFPPHRRQVEAPATWVTVSRPPATTTAASTASTRLFLYGGGVLADLRPMADTFLVLSSGPAKFVRRVRECAVSSDG